MTTSSTVRRPTGVTILAVLSLISGFVGLLGGCLLTGFGSLLAPVSALFGGAGLGNFALVGGIGWLISGIFSLVVGFGALALRPWAWILGLISVGLSLISAVFGMFQGGSWCLSLPGLIIPAVILYYLLTPAVKQAFGRA